FSFEISVKHGVVGINLIHRRRRISSAETYIGSPMFTPTFVQRNSWDKLRFKISFHLRKTHLTKTIKFIIMMVHTCSYTPFPCFPFPFGMQESADDKTADLILILQRIHVAGSITIKTFVGGTILNFTS